MKHLGLLTIVLLLVYSCTDEIPSEIEENQKTFTKAEIDQFISSRTQKNQVFEWSEASIEMIHSAAQESDQIIAIGYQAPGYDDMAQFIGTTEELPDAFIQKRQEIINQVLEIESREIGEVLSLSQILPYELDNTIPTIELRITSLAALQKLSLDHDIRYIEPMGYDPSEQSVDRQLKSSSGCSGSPDNINSQDYTRTSSFNAKIPWNFNNHNIPSAWSRADGDNISICIIDTGASDSQNNLGSQFTSGNSGSRFIQKYSTHYTGAWWWKRLESPHDQCGHGTSMAGLAAGPWSTDGNAVGAAYRANLITVRAVSDVIISSSNEKNGVKNALILAGNRSDVKVISMSIGNIISSGTVKDGVRYAYNRGKLIMAAAGTSTSFTNFVGVIFPANMKKVEFTIEMQRNFDNDRTSVGLASYSDTPQYIGGSSAATATTAGIAALVWSTNPNMSRTTVLNRLKQASQLYPNRSSSYGYGDINADAAVRGTGY